MPYRILSKTSKKEHLPRVSINLGDDYVLLGSRDLALRPAAAIHIPAIHEYY